MAKKGEQNSLHAPAGFHEGFGHGGVVRWRVPVRHGVFVAHHQPGAGDFQLVGQDHFRTEGHGVDLSAEFSEQPVFRPGFGARSPRVGEDRLPGNGSALPFRQLGDLVREFAGEESVMEDKVAVVRRGFGEDRACGAVRQPVVQHEQVRNGEGAVERKRRIEHADGTGDQQRPAIHRP